MHLGDSKFFNNIFYQLLWKITKKIDFNLNQVGSFLSSNGRNKDRIRTNPEIRFLIFLYILVIHGTWIIHFSEEIEKFLKNLAKFIRSFFSDR